MPGGLSQNKNGMLLKYMLLTVIYRQGNYYSHIKWIDDVAMFCCSLFYCSLGQYSDGIYFQVHVTKMALIIFE